MKKNIVKNLGIVMAAVMLVTGCGASDGGRNATEAMSEEAYETYEYAAEDVVEEKTESGAGYGNGATNAEVSEEQVKASNQSERKLIKTIDIELETLEYEKTIDYIEKRVTNLGGYIESSNLDGSSIYEDFGSRYGELKIRIPKEKTNDFVTGIDENTNIRRKSESTEDITLNYIDVESHKEALKVEQQRLMEILEKAETVEDIISLESRLSEVRYEIGTYESKLRTYDNLVDYSTINIFISEVQEITEAPKLTTMERITEGFAGSVKDILKGIKEFVIGFIITLPYLVVWGIVIGIIAMIIRKILKHKKKKKETEEK